MIFKRNAFHRKQKLRKHNCSRVGLVICQQVDPTRGAKVGGGGVGGVATPPEFWVLKLGGVEPPLDFKNI